jgi:hypothetical protein
MGLLVTRWPLWRLLIWIEVWLLVVAAFHFYNPIHVEFWIPLLMAVGPGVIVVAMWALARGATGHTAPTTVRARPWEVLFATIAVIAAAAWIVRWAFEARDDLRTIDEMLGQATIIVDVSVTWLSAAACFAALTIDWLLSAARGTYGRALTVLRRTHIVVSVCHVAALFGAAWLFTQWPDAAAGGSGTDSAALLNRARAALHVYEYARATLFPVQAFFAAVALLLATLNTRSGEVAQ